MPDVGKIRRPTTRLTYLDVMAKAENEDIAGPRPRFTTLLPSEHLRRTAVKAGRELDIEQADSVVSIARLLDNINEVESRADLQTRIVMLEEQVERLSARRDEVDQAIDSELDVLRTTIESAMEAVASLILPPPAPEASTEGIDALRKEFDEKLMAARSDLRFEILNLSKELPAAPAVTGELEAIREDFQSRLDASDERVAKSAAYLEDLVNEQREHLAQEKARHAEVIQRLSVQLAGFAAALAEAGPGPAKTGEAG